MSSAGTVQGVASEVESAVRDGADSRPLGWAARLGLAARGVVYLLMGLLAVLVARGAAVQVDQEGALAQVVARPYGELVVAAMAAGFAGYALWRLSEAAFGVSGEGRRVGPRVQSLVRGLVYVGLALSAVAVLQGSRTSQSSQQQSLTARAMEQPGGRWLVAAIGVVILGVGLALVAEGVRLRFMRYFLVGALSPRVRHAVRVLGAVGTVARGLVFALTGGLVVAAAWTYDPAKASGLDGALKTLRDQPFGPLLLTAAGAGLVAFGLYGLTEARYRRV
jgi:hypothetical protein